MGQDGKFEALQGKILEFNGQARMEESTMRGAQVDEELRLDPVEVGRGSERSGAR